MDKHNSCINSLAVIQYVEEREPRENYLSYLRISGRKWQGYPIQRHSFLIQTTGFHPA